MIEFRAADDADLIDLDFGDEGGVDGEYAFDSFAAGHVADGDHLLDARALHGNDHAGEDLDAFFVAFANERVNGNAVPNFKFGIGAIF